MWERAGPGPVAVVPSPKLHEYDAIGTASGSVVPEASNDTAAPARDDAGELSAVTGGLPTTTCRVVVTRLPLVSTTSSVAV